MQNVQRIQDSIASRANPFFVENVVRSTVGGGSIFIVARALGAADFGRYATVLAISALFAAVADGGTSQAVARSLANGSNPLLVRHHARNITLRSVSVAVVLEFLALWIVGMHDKKLFIAGLFAISADAFRARSWMDQVLLMSGSKATLARARTTGLLLGSLARAAVAIHLNSLELVCATLPVEAAVTMYLVRRSMRPTVDPLRSSERGLPPWRSFGPHLVVSASLLQVLGRIDQLMLPALSSTHEAGLYGTAARLSDLWHVYASAVVLNLSPEIMRHNPWTTSARRSVRALFLVFIGTIAATMSVIPIAVDRILGADYEGVSTVLKIHIASGLCITIHGLASIRAVATGQESRLLIRNAFGSATNVGLNLVLIPAWGASGAAFATLWSYALIGPGWEYLYRSPRYRGVWDLVSPRRLRASAG